MPRITLQLIRKRSEHNEGEISTLEEISLHQENIEKIELIDKTCRNLKILLLQHNLVSRIENLGRLKRLEYLNLALNNIEVIENLEGLESLKKLDLTINFIGDLRGVEKLRRNENLEQLILMGNPCADYHGYREYVAATLTRLKELDSRPIDRSERIRALQVYGRIEGDVIRDYARYKRTREAQIARHREKTGSRIERDRDKKEEEDADDDNDDEKFWKEPSRHTPEDRIAIAERFLRKEKEKSQGQGSSEERAKYVVKLFGSEGRPYNVNQAKVPFDLDEEDGGDRVVLRVAVYKYLDTSYVDVDVQPHYVRVTIKGKVLQLTLPFEVSVERSTAERNATNGKLKITMPRIDSSIAIGKVRSPSREKRRTEKTRSGSTIGGRSLTTRREYLEIGPPTDPVDFSKITARQARAPGRRTARDASPPLDDPNVPPLE